MPRKPSPKDRDRAEKFFRDRVPLTDSESEALSGRAKQQAFWASQVGDLRVADMVLKSLKRAIEFGEDLDTWKRKIGSAMRAAWGPGRRDRSGRVFDQGHRLALIYRNSMQSAHNGSRFKALRRPQTMALRPFWKFTNPTPESDICKELAGTVRPANDPWWDTHTPQMHHGCVSTIKALTTKEAARFGVTEDPPDVGADDGFGEVPTDATNAVVQSNLTAIDNALRQLFNAKTRQGP